MCFRFVMWPVTCTAHSSRLRQKLAGVIFCVDARPPSYCRGWCSAVSGYVCDVLAVAGCGTDHCNSYKNGRQQQLRRGIVGGLCAQLALSSCKSVASKLLIQPMWQPFLVFYLPFCAYVLCGQQQALLSVDCLVPSHVGHHWESSLCRGWGWRWEAGEPQLPHSTPAAVSASAASVALCGLLFVTKNIPSMNCDGWRGGTSNPG
jgi:hypothetical protein